MSDRFEQFIKENRGKFDTNSPSPDLWSRIETGIAEQATAGSSAGASASSTVPGATTKMAGIWKAALGIAAVAVIGTSLYFGINANNSTTNNNSESVVLPNSQHQPATENQDLAFEPTPFINPISESIDVEYFTLSFDAEKGTTWESPTGSVVNIPENTFVDENGTPVTGQVEVKYREFHDAVDVMFSGIPMVYEDENGSHDFETAGMMEIRGSQGEKPVYIAQGKELSVALASYTEEDDYNLYYLDEENRGWKDIGKAEIRNNESKTASLQKLDEELASNLPVLPKKMGQSENLFDFALDYKDFPELKPFKDIKWEYVDVTKVENNEWIFTTSWNEVKLLERVKPQVNTL